MNFTERRTFKQNISSFQRLHNFCFKSRNFIFLNFKFHYTSRFFNSVKSYSVNLSLFFSTKRLNELFSNFIFTRYYKLLRLNVCIYFSFNIFKTNCNDVIILDFYRRKFHRNVFFFNKNKNWKDEIQGWKFSTIVKFSTKCVIDLLQPPFNLVKKSKKKKKKP